VVRHPTQLARLVRHAAGLRIAVPLDALRWLVANTPPGKRSPTDVTIEARPPAIQLAATVDLMGTKLRASGAVFVEELRVSTDELRATLRLADVDMQVLGSADSPVAGLLKSGALDLSKPGNLVNFMPRRPKALIDARDDIITLDLLKIPKFAENFKLRRVLEALTPVVSVAALRTEDDMLILALRAIPAGLPRALAAARDGLGTAAAGRPWGSPNNV
jgi:hypothetical protein